MKNSIIALFLLTFLLMSCNQINKQNQPINDTRTVHDSTLITTDSTKNHYESNMKQEQEELYTCSMHPEIQGKLNDDCSKCGMKLTEEVK